MIDYSVHGRLCESNDCSNAIVQEEASSTNTIEPTSIKRSQDLISYFLLLPWVLFCSFQIQQQKKQLLFRHSQSSPKSSRRMLEVFFSAIADIYTTSPTNKIVAEQKIHVNP